MTDTANLRARIASELRRDNMSTQINREINSAIQHYESTRFAWNEIKNSEFAVTVSGTNNYTIPVGLIRMDTLKAIYAGNYINIHKKGWEEIDERDSSPDTNLGVPFNYAIRANQIRLYPTPNSAMTLVGSFIKRFPVTSLTGSYTTQTIYAGASTLTTTSTASHNNRLNGWTTDGEALIRARATAAVEINYLRKPATLQGLALMTQINKPFLSPVEQQAYQKLMDETSDMISTGRIRAHNI